MRPPSEGGKRSGSRYVLGDLLGRGGMAEVFAGHAVGDHGFQKPVAIKRLLPELANDDVFVERLIEEAKLLVGMQHGNIVSVLDLAREGEDVFLVMEFVDGPSLRQLIKARGTRGLSLGVATYIVQSAAAGLEFAHARPGGAIIHADISPSNLLLTTSGEVRVADFGIARREGLGHGVVEGKWAYMAPEQARGEALTPRSDVFALGVVLYELLTGQHPFGRAVTATERDDQMQVIPPRVVKSAIPPGIDAICMRALAHDPRQRYGRMQQLIDALVEERFCNGYREGASDLAQAIREVAPRSELGSPRTMHTDRPVTIVTKSLLREVTPARRGSAPPGAMAPVEPPPSEFAPVPTMGVPTTALPAEPPPGEFAPVPTMAVPTTAMPAEPLPSLYPMVPPSGAQTTARVVDQIALAQAASAAAAMLELPAVLHADGAPMPPFRASRADMRGDELASVVGGHTLTSHGVAAMAIEGRSYRWAIAVLGAATLIGVGAAIAIQLAHARPDEPSPARAATVRPADQDSPSAAPGPSTPEARAGREAREAPEAPRSGDLSELRAGQPVVPDPPALPRLRDAAAPLEPGGDDRTGDHRADDGTAAARPGDSPGIAAVVDDRRSGSDRSGDDPRGLRSSDRTGDDARRGDRTGDDARNPRGGDRTGDDARNSRTGDDARNSRGGDRTGDDARNPRGGDRTAEDVRGPRSSDRTGDDTRNSRTGDDARNSRGGDRTGDDARNSRISDRSGDRAGSDHTDDLRGDGKASARAGEGKGRRSGDGRSGDGRSGDGRSGGKKLAVAKDVATKHKGGPGILQVDSEPWSWVTVDVETKETPSKFYLPPGVHTVKFYNENNDLTKYETVVIEADVVTKLNEDMKH